jgi:hypothetical protein
MFSVLPRSFYLCMIFAILSSLAAILGFPALVGVHGHARTHTHTHTRCHQSLIPHVLYFIVFVSLACEKFAELSYGMVESIVILQCSTCLCWQPFCTFKEHKYSLLAAVSCAVTGTWHSAVPHSWCNGILTGFFFQGPDRWQSDGVRSGL